MSCAYCKNIAVCAICGKGVTAAAHKPAADKYDEVLLPFLALMRKELHANAGKGDRPGWLKMDRKTALLEVHHHLAKLQKAVLSDDHRGVIEYSADVANMAMMVLDVTLRIEWAAMTAGISHTTVFGARAADADSQPSDQRQRFEVWADDQGFPLKRLETSDGYLDLRTHGAWDAWQAATSGVLGMEEPQNG
jgi:hypothetical protein